MVVGDGVVGEGEGVVSGGGTRNGQRPRTANIVAFALCHCSCAVCVDADADADGDGDGGDRGDDALLQVVIGAVSVLGLRVTVSVGAWCAAGEVRCCLCPLRLFFFLFLWRRFWLRWR